MKKILFLCLLAGITSLAFIYTTDYAVFGKITDENGQPVPGATITLKGTHHATVSDTGGNFTIMVPNEKVVLVISWVGYQSKEVRAGSGTQLNIKLSPTVSALSEVVVTGYSTVKKKDLTGSVSTVITDQYLTGNAPGVYISGSPGANPAIRLRAPQIVADEETAEDDNRSQGYFNTEGYGNISENPFLKVNDNPLSTFSIDVDAASYSNVRRFINEGQLPPAGAVRIEELINYFSYQYPQPANNDPFSVTMELSSCPWNQKHELVLVGLQGKKIPVDNLPPSNLVFLIDVSGSMDEPDKLPLVQASLKLLVDQLRPQDKVALVAYAGNAGLVLPATNGDHKTQIKEAINKLNAGGSTAGGAGIQLAYTIAKENFVKDGNNRVILCTDGDFNVGLSSDDALVNLIEEKRKSGVFLTVLGYGTGNYQDNKMQQLADKGNGNHAYIDGINEAKKVLLNEFGGTLFTIAKDVKLQIEFNPDKVKAYRLIGYENRMLAKEDFNNDKKDAGELGSGHTVTALYEIVSTNVRDERFDSVDALRYRKPKNAKITNPYSSELMNVKLRFKKPEGDASSFLQFPLYDKPTVLEKTSSNFRFASAVAGFGMLLRNSEYKGNDSFDMVSELAKNARGDDKEGYRREFIDLVENASLLKGKKDTAKE